MVERVRLHHRKQQPDESVQLYFDGLKQIASNCQFTAAEYDGRLHDIFVAGLKPGSQYTSRHVASSHVKGGRFRRDAT